jgi:hypothetical protein
MILRRIFGPEGERNRRLEKLQVLHNLHAHCILTSANQEWARRRVYIEIFKKNGVGGCGLDFVSQDSDQLHPIVV